LPKKMRLNHYSIIKTNMDIQKQTKEILIGQLIAAGTSSFADDYLDELRPIFLKEHPEVLDDDMNEAFDRWLTLEVEAYENLKDLQARANDDE
jgi:hypothetical protein